MRGSSFTTFLMFLPLVAIPLLAIFGIPEFRPVNASIPTEPHNHNGARDLESAAGRKSSTSSKDKTSDLFAPLDVEQKKPTANRTERQNVDPFRQAEKNSRLKGWQLDDRRNDGRQTSETPNFAHNSPFAERNGNNDSAGIRRQINPRRAPLGQVGQETSLKEPLTWKVATEQLKQWGINNFVLQPGDEPNVFHFSCLCPSERNPRIVHRYEAEDAEPLQAVAKVLRQIESRRRQY